MYQKELTLPSDVSVSHRIGSTNCVLLVFDGKCGTHTYDTGLQCLYKCARQQSIVYYGLCTKKKFVGMCTHIQNALIGVSIGWYKKVYPQISQKLSDTLYDDDCKRVFLQQKQMFVADRKSDCTHYGVPNKYGYYPGLCLLQSDSTTFILYGVCKHTVYAAAKHLCIN
jgi:hypothetical protein